MFIVMGVELMGISIEEVLSEENIAEAMSFLMEKRDSCGIDGVMLSDLPDYLEVNKERIYDSILTCKYEPGIVKLSEIVNSKKKHRTISLMNSIDRLIYRALLQVMAPLWEPLFSAHSYAYQENKGVKQALDAAAEYIKAGNEWIAEIDIHSYFDNINHGLMLEKLKEKIDDEAIMSLLVGYIKCTVAEEYDYHQKDKGLLQGGPLSPLLSNIYLNDLDQLLDKKGIFFCRFGDDINIYCPTSQDAFAMYESVAHHLKEVELLQLSTSKSGVFKALNRKYLGYTFEEKSGQIVARREKKAERTVYRDWYTTGITRVDRNYHLINNGVLTKKDYTLLFESEDGKKYIPVETTDSLYVYSNTIFSTNFFEFVNKRGIGVSIIDKHGEKVGAFIPQNNRRNIKTELSQLKVYDDEQARLELARRLEIASVSNLRANLKYYERRKNSVELAEVIANISRFIQRLNEAPSINALMTIEAQARQQYYQAFNYILEDPDFIFRKRTRRPPEDPLNAMISFGNTLLYQRIANDINRTSLDIRIGIIHAAGSRPESLNLDLADLFKPIIVDRAIFTLINRKMLKRDDFVEVENDGIYLSNSGKRTFIQEFENKLYQKITFDGGEHTYDYVVKTEIQHLKNYFERGDKYKPYKYS